MNMTSEIVEDNMNEHHDVVDYENKDNEAYRKVIFEPIRIGSVSTLDEMDCKVLQFQNKKLQMKLDEYQRIEDELQRRIEELEKRQNQDETVMNVVNSYWDHLNLNVKNVLSQYDDLFQTTLHEVELDKTLSFMKTLATCSESHIDQKLMSMVKISLDALSKVLRDYDYVLAKNETALAVMKLTLENYQRVSPITTDQYNDILPLDNEEMFLENEHRPPSIDHFDQTNQSHSSNQTLYETQNECIEGLDSVSESETSDRAEKPIKSPPNSELVTENGLRDSYSSSSNSRTIQGDDEIITQLVDEIVNQVATVDRRECYRVHCISDVSDFSEKTSNDMNDDDDEVFMSLSDVVNKASAEQLQRTSPSQEVRSILSQVEADNKRLKSLIGAFQRQYEESSAKEEFIMKALQAKEEEYEKWKVRIEDIEYENEKLKHRKIKIERHLVEAVEISQKIKARQVNPQCKADVAVTNGRKFEDLEDELEIQRELTLSRSQELELLRAKYESTLNDLAELEKSMNDIPDEVVEDTTEYKCLQSQFSVLYNDTMQIKDQIEEYHAHIQTLNATFANKMEMTETEDLMTLRKLQADLQEMQSTNTQLKDDYQELKIEYEKNLIANEETGPLNREMRYLLARLQKHNKHLKMEAQRYKHRYKQLNAELNAISKQSYNESKFKISELEGGSSSDLEDSEFGLETNEEFFASNAKEETKVNKEADASEENKDTPTSPPPLKIKEESRDYSPSSPSSSQLCLKAGPSRTCSKMARRKRHEYHKMLNCDGREIRECGDIDDTDDEKLLDDEYGQDLRVQFKKAEAEQKELKMLLDTYRGVSRDKREKMQLMCAEKKLKSDIEETKAQMRRILEIKRENRKKMADEDALKKIKYLEEQNYILMRQINVHKQEEEALLSEMEVTNQAFEDMQEQNSRLIQQLREKDDANSKLMAERIKSNLMYKITREENCDLEALESASSKQFDAVATVMNELEEKEQVYQTAISNVEKEINLRQQALDLHRRKAVENAQIVSDAKLTLEIFLSNMQESKKCMIDKLTVLDDETFKCNRLQEEVTILRRHVERLKKLEPTEHPDIVLVEEVREYKEMLTCQSCKVRRKDAVLSKCFHVFCWECLRTRYETRQRKCPKCNATFGANDYHRLFFTN